MSAAINREDEAKIQVWKTTTCEELNTLCLVFTNWTLDETPCVIELCLGRDMRIGYLLFVLRAQNLHMNGGSSQPISAGKNKQDELEARHTKGRLLHQRHMGPLRSSCRSLSKECSWVGLRFG